MTKKYITNHRDKQINIVDIKQILLTDLFLLFDTSSEKKIPENARAFRTVLPLWNEAPTFMVIPRVGQ